MQQFGNPNNTDLSAQEHRRVQTGQRTLGADFVAPYSLHFNVGVQREILPDLVLSADFVLRRSVHRDTGGIDFNRWNSATGPVIPGVRRAASA